MKGIIDKYFVDDPDLGKIVFSNHKIVDIESDIRRSEIELANYELKQGLLPLTPGGKDPTDMLDKILRTICAISNNGPNSAGKILIGISDKDDDVKRVLDVDGVSGKSVGKRTVVGVSREAKRLGVSVESYVQTIVNHIKNSNISEHTKGAVLSHIDYNNYFDLGVIVISIPPQSELTYLGDELFRRDGSSNNIIINPKDAVALNSRFEKGG